MNNELKVEDNGEFGGERVAIYHGYGSRVCLPDCWTGALIVSCPAHQSYCTTCLRTKQIFIVRVLYV